MKTLGISTFFLLYFFSLAQAQENATKENKYKVWISTINEPYFYKGSLYKLNDSSVIINSVLIKDTISRSSSKVELHINEIEIIEIRRRNRVGFGLVIGAFTGLAVGGILGFASGDDTNGGLTANEKAALGGFTLAIPGALVGALVGSSKIIIPINRSASKYTSLKPQLRTYTTIR